MHLKGLLLGIALISGSALADTQTEILSDKLDRLEAEMALIQKKVYQAPVVAEAPVSKVPNNIDEFYATLDAQNQTLQELTQKNEQMSHELSELKGQLSRMNEDINFRFNELKQAPASDSVQKVPPDVLSEEENYNRAYSLLKNGEYEKAEQHFLAFMEKYPDGKLVSNANYWLAESYYARQKLPEAAGLFADGFTKYKGSAKALDSMFKLGLTMKQLDKTKEACTAFKKLLKEDKKLTKQLKERTEKEVKEMKCP